MGPRTSLSGPRGSTENRQSGSRKGPLSCAECRRLKLRCDRQVPCSNCVRRKCVEFCPTEIKPGRKVGSGAFDRVIVDDRDKPETQKDPTNLLIALDDLLSQHGMSIQRKPEGPVTLVPQASQLRQSSDSLQSTAKTDDANDRGASSFRFTPRSRSKSPTPRQNPIHHTYSPVQPIPADPTPVRFEYNLPSSSSASLQTELLGHGGPSPNATSGQSQESPQESHGTLVLGRSGRSRYLGPTAGPEWLRSQEVDGDKTPAFPRSGSPVNTARAIAFPFERSFAADTAEAILARLPPEENGASLMEAYYRYFAWNHNPAPRPTLQKIFEEAYSPRAFDPAPNCLRQVGHQRLALLFIVFALGALHSLELPPNDPSAEEYFSLAKTCLAKGDFMRNNTLAGVQALNIMGHYHLDQEAGRDGESAWPLWGLVIRISQAMGLHRDGERWNLPEDVVQERRRVFWECYTIEVFQANCNSRPSSLHRRHIDTCLPHDPPHLASIGSFSASKFGLARISHEILDQAMDVESPPYSEIQRLYSRLCSFERDIPFHLRCRTAMISMTSVYPEVDLAIRNSPEVDKRNLRNTLEQFTLSLNMAENFLFLQRPYFVRAIHEHQADPLQSPFGDAYLAVIERCSVIIQVVRVLYELYPDIAARHWFYWYHLFTAAVCLGTIPIKNPSNLLSQYALIQLNQAIEVYASLRTRIQTTAIAQNHEWLCKLQTRAQDQVQAGLGVGGPSTMFADEETEDSALLGWRTRLIQHAAAEGGRRAKTTITSVTPPVPLIAPWSNPTNNGGANVVAQDGPVGFWTASEVEHSDKMEEDFSAGDLLQQLWDDMLHPGARTGAVDFTSFTSWNWDAGVEDLLHSDRT